MEPSCGVHDHNIRTTRLGGLNAVERHGSGVGALSVGNNIEIETVSPYLKLVDSGCTERVPRSQQHELARLFIEVCQSRNCCGFAYAVDSDHQYDQGWLVDVHRLVTAFDAKSFDHL